MLVTAGADGTVRVLDPRKSFCLVHTINLPSSLASQPVNFPYSLAVAGGLALIGCGDGTLHFVDIQQVGAGGGGGGAGGAMVPHVSHLPPCTQGRLTMPHPAVLAPHPAVVMPRCHLRHASVPPASCLGATCVRACVCGAGQDVVRHGCEQGCCALHRGV